MTKYIIVGGVAGGATAAARLRRLDEHADIILLERTSHVSFANCGLPYYVGGEIQTQSQLLIQTPQGMRQRFNIDVRVDSEVLSIDCTKKCVAVRHRENVEDLHYDKLLLAPGARPVRPKLPGIDDPRILTLRHIEDVEKIRASIGVSDRNALKVAVIGGGFIGVEMAENLKATGARVTLLEAGPQILAPFDEDIAAFAEYTLLSHDIDVKFEHAVSAFEPLDDVIRIRLSDHSCVDAHVVILAIGVTPDTEFLRQSAVQLDEKGFILVDEEMKTSAPDVFAVGDAVRLFRFDDRRPMSLALAGPANHQGRCAADNMTGLHVKQNGLSGACIVKIFDQTAAAVGLNEKTLHREERPYHTVIAHPLSHAGYYPGARQMVLKLIFDTHGKILGAQAIGPEGVDKRIDVLSAMIRMGATIDNLTDLELCYAPPYSSAKDPVNMIGYMAENICRGMSHSIRCHEWRTAVAQGAQLVDVRTKNEYERGHLDGAVNIPLDEIRNHLDRFDKAVPVILYCQVGLRGYYAERILAQLGYQVRNLVGGYRLASMVEYMQNYKKR